MNGRKSGILLHVSSLPSPFGIGDLGPAAFGFADFLAKSGQSYWQVLPLNPTEEAYGNSPYSGPSSYAGNPLFISPEIMIEDGYLAKSDVAGKPRFGSGGVNYKKASEYKSALFEKAFGKVSGKLESDDGYADFVSANDYWLEDFCLYMAIKDALGSPTWRDFPSDLRDRNEKSLKSWKKKTQRNVRFNKFVQYMFYRQWRTLKDYCHGKGIKIIGDIPYYVNYDSSEVWSSPSAFKLDEEKNPVFVSGVPPDYFSKTGQLWGNPVYDWEEIKRTGYEWWIKRIGHNLALFDILRLDHFRGFVGYWEVAAGEKTALSGKWVKVDAVGFFDKLFAAYDKSLFIAEDLGDITPDVREIIKRYDLPGMKILLFAFGDDYPNSEYLPGNFTENCVIYTGTHDNNTVAGWWKNEAGAKEKERFYNYTGRRPGDSGVSGEFIRLAMSSAADTAIIPMQDVLGLGQLARMNTPSVKKGNWKWRLRKNQVTPELARMLAETARINQRA